MIRGDNCSRGGGGVGAAVTRPRRARSSEAAQSRGARSAVCTTKVSEVPTAMAVDVAAPLL